MRKILICASPHQFGAVQSPAEMMVDGLHLCGHQAIVFTMDENKGISEFVRFLKENTVDLVIALGPSLMLLRHRFTRLYNYVKTPICVFFLDDPAYHIKALVSLLTNSRSSILLLAPEMNQVIELDKYILRTRFSNVATMFFPWAGPAPKYPRVKNNCLYDCAVFCTLDQQIAGGVDSVDLISKIGNKYHYKEIDSSLRQMYSQDYLKPVARLLSDVTGQEFWLGDPSQLKLWTRLDSLIKKNRRLAMAQELIEIARIQKLKILVCGTGWDKIGHLPQSITALGPLHYNTQFEIFRKSKFMINLDPNWTHGVHDRIYNAMSVGCAVITNINDFISDNFVVGKEILTFSKIKDLSGLLLENDSAKIVNNAFKSYTKAHTWRDRMSYMLQSI